MKIVIVGLGSIGRRHLRNLLALGERDIVLCRTHRSTLPEDELKDFRVETDLRAALALGAQAVIVSNPTSLHVETALEAARAGCAVFLEKPVSHTLEKVADLQAAVRRKNGRVLVGFQYRFHQGMRKVKQLLAEDAIGKALAVRAHYGEYLPGWHPWEDYHQAFSARADLGGGVILTLCHPLDYLRYLLGEVEEVWALVGYQGGLGIDVEDSAEIGLRFANGVLGSVHLNYVQRPAAHWMEIIGARGVIRWEYQQNAVHVNAEGRQAFTWQGEQADVRNPMFVEEMRHFLALARGEETSLCTLQDGVRALEIALAAYESERQGKRIKIS